MLTPRPVHLEWRTANHSVCLAPFPLACLATCATSLSLELTSSYDQTIFYKRIMDEPTTMQALQTLKKSLYPKKQKKRYQPPQPDKHTYASQEDFVASLHAISLDDVEPEQKCPTCWKPFGEAPDFGFDNSELPVKLRCGHVFGNKCLANTFALPELSRLILEPLSFQAGKKGLQLGQMLNQYARTHGANFRDITEMFAHMLATMSTPGTCRDQLFGNYWFERFLDIQQIEGDLASITFMENAIVLDSKPPVPSIWNRATGSMDKTLLPSPPDSLNDTSLPSSSCEFGFATGYCEFPSMFPPPTTAKSLGLEPEVPQQGIAGPNDATQGTWQEALSNETKLDKLAALQKLNKDVPTAIDQALVNASIALAAEHKTKQKAHHVEHMAMQSEHMAHKKGQS
jgi:hypothetical protein